MNILLFSLLFIILPTVKHNPELLAQKTIQIHIIETCHVINELSDIIDEEGNYFEDDLLCLGLMNNDEDCDVS